MTDNVIRFEPPSGGGVLPMIHVVDGEIARVVDELQDILINAGKPVFIRAGALVQPIYVTHDAGDGRKTRVTIIQPYDAGRLRYLVNKRVVRFVRHDGRRRRVTVIDPPEKVLSTLLVLKHWKFQQLYGVFNSPTMRPDGSIICDRGYDAETHLWLEWEDDIKLPFDVIHGQPTKDDAIAALQLLKGLMTGFPFVSQLDEAIALAAIMTAVLHGAFNLSPMFLFVAHTSGDGKSYMADLIAAIATGKLCPVIAASRSEEEMQKQLATVLLDSPSMISLDNLTRDVNDEILCQMCTQTFIKVRILGKSEMSECTWRGTLLGTGNNIQFSADMLRRGLTCQINAKMENPESRHFAFDPIERVLQDRGKYIAAVLTIARAYILDENKVQCAPNGFNKWSAMVREPLLWLGCEDPAKSVAAARTQDRARVADKIIIGWVVANFGTRPFTARALTEAARDQDLGNFGGAMTPLRHPELHDALLEVAPGARNQLEVRSVGRWLTKTVGKTRFLVIDGICADYSIEIFAENSHDGHKFRALQRNPENHPRTGL